MEKEIREKIGEWTKTHAVKYHDSSTDISPAKQLDVLSSLFVSLRDSGILAEDVLPFMQMIASPLAPRDIKSLKKIRKYRFHKDEEIRAALSRWCGAATENLVEAFNEVFYPDGEDGLDGRPIYEWMCKKRNVQPSIGTTSKPTDEDIRDHMVTEPIEGLSIGRKKNLNTVEIDKNDDTIEGIMKRYRPFQANPDNVFAECPSVSGPDQDALEFFGLVNIPREKL